MSELLKDIQFQKNFLWFNGLLPILLLAYDYFSGNLGANPPEALIRTFGVVSLIYLLLTLCVTPVSKSMKWPWLVRHRRWLGLISFYYALLHLLSYALFDKGLRLNDILSDIAERPFILLGNLGFLMMLALAVTSTNEMIKKMGVKNWKNLHRLTYIIAVLGVFHYYLIVKSDLFYPLAFGILFAIVLATRFRFFKKT